MTVETRVLGIRLPNGLRGRFGVRDDQAKRDFVFDGPPSAVVDGLDFLPDYQRREALQALSRPPRKPKLGAYRP